MKKELNQSCLTPIGMQRHKSDLEENKGIGPQKELIIMSAGTVCKDVSAIGNNMGLLGPSSRPLAIFLSELRVLQPQLVLHECTGRFLRDVFFEYLHDLYDIYTVQKPTGGEAWAICEQYHLLSM